MAGYGGDVLRFAPGEYYKADKKESVAVKMARSELLFAFRDIAKKGMSELEDKVFPKFEEMCNALERPIERFGSPEQDLYDLAEADPDPPQRPSAEPSERMKEWLSRPDVQSRIASGELVRVEPQTGPTNPHHLILKEPLFEWFEKYRFDQDWMREAVVGDFYFFRRDRSRPDESQLGFPLGYWWGTCPVYGVPNLDAEMKFEFILEEGYHPVCETWEVFELRLKARFDEYVRNYRQRLYDRLEELHYRRAPVKRKCREHFRWLAKRYFGGQSWEAIAGPKRTVATVRGAVVKTAALAQLAIPEGKRGRPAKAPSR
ncbi:MAG TPA: hypothetical protein VJ835_06950 [Fimbriimonadaceae bacterium]|nr:hypothetical protein [Fimbriimonadaceae bacterium]